jgi:hypothetical protein
MTRRLFAALTGISFALLLQFAVPAIAEDAKSAAKPAAAQDEVFTVVLLPDTQNYSERYPETYVAQAMWIRERLNSDNLKFVVGLGDVVQNAGAEKEWQNADVAAKILDGVVPYSIVPGNHDLVPLGKARTRETTLFRKYFPPARYEKEPWYGGHLGEGNDNNYCVFEAAGRRFLVLSLEFCPTDETLAWASGIVERHPNHNVIVATHCYMNTKGRENAAPTTYKLVGNSGEQLWQKFVSKHPNIFLVACGHHSGVLTQTSTNAFGGKVIEILTDYQNLKNGGDGWLRTMKFVPSENKIYVDAYSPLLKEHNPDARHTHTIDLDFAKLPLAKEAK